MRLPNSLILTALALAGSATAQTQLAPPDDMPKGEGPRGTSQAVPGQDRYDDVGYAVVEGMGDNGALLASHRKLPPGTFVEVTSLASGKTIGLMVAGAGPAASDRLIGLSPAAAAALGIDNRTAAGVRVRAIEPSQPDQAALKAGRPGSERLDAPPILLTALRKRLPAPPKPIATPVAPPAYGQTYSRPTPQPPKAAAQPPSQPGAGYAVPGTNYLPPSQAYAPPVQGYQQPQPNDQQPTYQQPAYQPAPAYRSPARAPAAVPGGLYVQVAALSDPSRASALAGSLGGSVVAGGGFYRVRLGPYRDYQTAEMARDAVAQRGYADARIVTNH